MPQMQQQIQQMPQMQQMPDFDEEPSPPVIDNSYEPIPCTINTFGYGGDHNPHVLKGIAEAAWHLLFY